MRKILITGASGYLASLVRTAFSDSTIYLFSRRYINPSANELYFESKSLYDNQWWENFKFDIKFDLIFHFAESVKNIESNDNLNILIKSHTSFLELASSNSSRVIYPISAYKYDNKLSKSNFFYNNLKFKIISNISNNNIYYPVIHPFIDNPKGNLYKFLQFVYNLPFFNFFVASNASIPYLTEEYFIKSANNFFALEKVNSDFYAGVIKYSVLFNSTNKVSNLFVSKIFLFFLSFLEFIPAVSLILSGRKIYAKNM